MEQDKNKEEKAIGFITKASAAYCDKFPLRSAIQAIPYLGSSLDTMLAGLGANYKYKRLEDFIAVLNKRLSNIEKNVNIEPSEPLFDFMMQIFDQVSRTRSKDKRKKFANLVANQVLKRCDWDEAEAAYRLISDLSDINIQVLDLAITIGHRKHPFENIVKVTDGLCPVTISDKWANDKYSSRQATDLRPHFPSLSQSAFQVICSELESKGLLRDRGLDYADRRHMEVFVATDLAQWLIDWISESIHR
ncbi:MAG TPA: hypothetical protein HPP66_08215 [Planctomycetes bacterium]|nr:hypothetical protein [Planctomycetota bacterium]